MCQIKSNQTNSMLKEVIHDHDNRFRAVYGDVYVCVCVCACVRVQQWCYLFLFLNVVFVLASTTWN